MKRVITLLSLVVFMPVLFSCGQQTPVGGLVSFNESSIIVGDVDWQEVTTLDSSHPIRMNSKAVADVQFANGGRCSGFMISDDVLMTNEHCVGSASDVIGMKVFLKHEKDVSKSSWAEISCHEFIGNDVHLDFALVKCSGSPGAVYGHVELSTEEPTLGSDIYVVQQNCDYYNDRSCDWSKKFSFGKTVEVESEIEIAYDADTLGGSSGSPVFLEDTHKVVAIHHAGYGGNWMGRGEKNTAVKMSEIVPFIMQKFPGVLAQDAQGDTPSEDDNETFETATLLSASKKIQKLSIDTQDDVDTFAFDMKKGERFSFKILFKHAQGDLDFKVYKKVGDEVVFVKAKDSSTDNESVKMKVSTTSTYYVQVFGYRGAMTSYDVVFSK